MRVAARKSTEDRRKLDKWASSRHAGAFGNVRGLMPTGSISAGLGIDANKVGRWRTRYAKEGSPAIEKERPRGANHGGKDTRAQAALRTRVIEATTQTAPEDADALVAGRWRGASARAGDAARVRRISGNIQPCVCSAFRDSIGPSCIVELLERTLPTMVDALRLGGRLHFTPTLGTSGSSDVDGKAAPARRLHLGASTRARELPAIAPMVKVANTP